MTDEGRKQVQIAGQRLSEKGYIFTRAYTSPLQRAAESLQVILESSNVTHKPPILIDSALNERDYGQLNGRSKDEVAEEFGAEQTNAWRRGYDAVPPGGESLQMTVERVWSFYQAEIEPRLRQGERILVVSHGNTLRGLVMAIEGMSPEEVRRLEIGYAATYTYRVDETGTIVPEDRQAGFFSA